MKNRIDNSRKKTPWDNSNDEDIIAKFIKEKYVENYKYKHPKLIDTKESEILNSIIINECRYCNSKNIKKNGFTKNKVQKYYCNNCKRNFTATTGTIFENHKISITEWIEFLLNIFNYGSTTLTSKVNKNSINTSIFWLHKVFILLKHWQDSILLSGDVYIDEMFYKVIKEDIKTNEGKQLRGLSENQYCIGVGYDGKNIIALVEGTGKPSSAKTKETFGKHIDYRSRLIHDDEKSHRELVKDLALEEERYNSFLLKKLDDKENPLRPINHQCDLIRQFLNTHSGFNREDLQDYLNLYCFMNSNPKNKLKKVKILLNLALTTKITLKYRDLFEIKN